MLVAGKRKYIHKTIREKCQSLKNLENGESNNDVAAKYNLPKNTLSTRVKNKQKPFDALKKGINVNPIQDALFSGLLTDGGGQKGPPLPKICLTHATMMKLGTVIPYPKKI